MSNLLYNYSALVMEVQSPNTIIALVDHGFRSWSMRQFRLPGVPAPDPRSVPRGPDRDASRAKAARFTEVLGLILNAHPKTCILVCPEKPSFSGHFSAGVFMPVKNPHGNYCVRINGKSWLDVAKLMRDLCTETLSEADARTFITTVEPTDFIP